MWGKIVCYRVKYIKINNLVLLWYVLHCGYTGLEMMTYQLHLILSKCKKEAKIVKTYNENKSIKVAWKKVYEIERKDRS